jgi:hypothetical protein
MELEQLYRQKGELVTQLEIAQAKLQQVNQQIVEIINKSSSIEQQK